MQSRRGVENLEVLKISLVSSGVYVRENTRLDRASSAFPVLGKIPRCLDILYVNDAWFKPHITTSKCRCCVVCIELLSPYVRFVVFAFTSE